MSRSQEVLWFITVVVVVVVVVALFDVVDALFPLSLFFWANIPLYVSIEHIRTTAQDNNMQSNSGASSVYQNGGLSI